MLFECLLCVRDYSNFLDYSVNQTDKFHALWILSYSGTGRQKLINVILNQSYNALESIVYFVVDLPPCPVSPSPVSPSPCSWDYNFPIKH